MPGALVVDRRLAAAAADFMDPGPTLAEALHEFGETHQITAEEFCFVAVRHPLPTALEVTTGTTVAELLAKLRKERDGDAQA